MSDTAKPCVYCGVTMQEVDADNGKAYLHKGECIIKYAQFLITKKAYNSMVTGEFGRQSTVLFLT